MAGGRGAEQGTGVSLAPGEDVEQRPETVPALHNPYRPSLPTQRF